MSAILERTAPAPRSSRTPQAEAFARDLARGLSATPKRLSPKYFYDEAGSRLFEEITRLEAYYPTRAEMEILATHGPEMGALLPEGAALVEFGSGSTAKIRLMLDALRTLSAYVPVDISGAFLKQQARDLATDHPGLRILPVVADFTRPFTLPEALQGLPVAGFFPGSTIGNFEPEDARAFLAEARRTLGRNAVMLVGVDLVKARAVLDAAYDDPQGVTARFNLNVLARANRELGTDFDLGAFHHRAFFNTDLSRVEMHLVARSVQHVRLDGFSYRFAAGESLHTESSYKYTLDGFGTLACAAGWSAARAWLDGEERFAVHLLT